MSQSNTDTAIDKIAPLYSIAAQIPFLCSHGLHIMKTIGTISYTKYKYCKRCGLIIERTFDREEDSPWLHPHWDTYYCGYLKLPIKIHITASEMDLFLLELQNLPYPSELCYWNH